MIEIMYFVYGYPTMRFSGVAVMISSADRATRNHAFGFFAASSVNGANSSPRSSRYSSSPTPRWPRRALSKIANVSHA